MIENISIILMYVFCLEFIISFKDLKSREKSMSFYRSTEVSHYKLILPRQSAWTIMNQLGQRQLIHVQQNPSAQVLSKPFFSQIKRCEEGLHKLSQIEQILKQKFVSYSHSSLDKTQIQQLFEIWSAKGHSHANIGLDIVESEIAKFWDYYNEIFNRIVHIQNNILKNRSNLAILRAGEQKFGRSFFQNNQKRAQQVGFLPNSPEDHEDSFQRHGASKLYFKTGVITIQEEMRFKKTVFRITKGNCYLHFEKFRDIFENILKKEENKVVFFIMFPGTSGNYLDQKLNRLITTYSDQVFDLPKDDREVQKRIKQLQDQYQESENLLTMNENQMKQFLHNIIEPVDGHQFTKIEYFKIFLIKEKEIFVNLNEMDLYQNFLQGSIFVENSKLELLQRTFSDIQKQSNHPTAQIIQSSSTSKPTHYSLNDYTRSAQQIVETYGVARYQEVNPSFFTTVTFPFLFGVMFGDIAHGLILLLFGLILNFKYREINSTPLRDILPHRYLFVLMGFFATYCGFVYNDFLSISINLFGSCYNPDNAEEGQAIPRTNDECVYSFGVDPIWAVSSNNLNYINSLKMKISVIIAVVHMTLGVFLKASNALYFKNYLDYFFEFIPQVLFLVLLFGYMDFLIVFKWLQPWPLYDPTAPSIITTMINLPLKLGKTENCCGAEPMWGTFGNTSQDAVQAVLLVIGIICVPMMLLPKPLYLIYGKKPKKSINRIEDQNEFEMTDLVSGQSPTQSPQYLAEKNHFYQEKNHEEEEQKQEEPSEIFVHQLIETIEYVLGCISNTASYLRLWALSLAHSQLSQVFFNKTVEGGIASGYSGIPIMIFGFFVLAAATFGVLLCMDSMQCFLHTLRLHWVEFQNKFYKGDGIPWRSYSFRNVINSELQK